jgi:hypothetical protein
MVADIVCGGGSMALVRSLGLFIPLSLMTLGVAFAQTEERTPVPSASGAADSCLAGEKPSPTTGAAGTGTYRNKCPWTISVKWCEEPGCVDRINDFNDDSLDPGAAFTTPVQGGKIQVAACAVPAMPAHLKLAGAKLTYECVPPKD